MPTVTDDLATVLFRLNIGNLSTHAVTALITRRVVAWALVCGWLPMTEACVRPSPSSGGQPRLGYVDVIVRRGTQGPDLAIEIDSADKPWSVAKLRYAAEAGMYAIWVRWGDAAWAGVYDEVDVIQLPLGRRPAARRRREGQMTVW